MRETAVEQQYHLQGKAGKGLLRCYIAKRTGLSRAQVTRLIGQYLATGKVEEKGYRRRRFPSLYTRRDIELLAEVDEAHETLSGPATQKILYREFHEYGGSGYERLARLSVAHLYNLRKTGEVSKTAGRVSGHPTDGGEHRGEAAAGPARPARIPTRRYGPPGRPRRKQRRVSPQCGG